MIFSLYMFDRRGTCLFSKEWQRIRPPSSPDQTTKLMYGMLFSLKKFVERLAIEGARFKSYTTDSYKLHMFESGSGIKMVLCTDVNVEQAETDLKDIYAQVYVPFCAKDVQYTPGEPISNPLFERNLDDKVKALHYFS